MKAQKRLKILKGQRIPIKTKKDTNQHGNKDSTNLFTNMTSFTNTQKNLGSQK